MDTAVARFTASDSVAACAIGDSIALLDMRTSTYFSLNEVGAKIWQMLEAPRSLDELCAAVVADYAVDPVSCRKDVAALLGELDAARLIRADGAPEI